MTIGGVHPPPPPPHIPLSMDTQFGDKVIVHSSISTKATLENVKNTWLLVQTPTRRISLLHTTIIRFVGGTTCKTFIVGKMKVAFKG